MTNDTTISACCRDCTNRKPVTGACGHANRQALVTYFADGGTPDCPCYASRQEDR